MFILDILFRLGGEKTIDAIQHLASNFGNLNRNQLRRDLGRWLCPPDPTRVQERAFSALRSSTYLERRVGIDGIFLL